MESSYLWEDDYFYIIFKESIIYMKWPSLREVMNKLFLLFLVFNVPSMSTTNIF
jgi:hypothetical protein